MPDKQTHFLSLTHYLTKVNLRLLLITVSWQFRCLISLDRARKFGVPHRKIQSPRDPLRRIRRIALHADRKLKALRNARSLTGRQVEQASRRIAAAKGDKRFSISNGWLTQLEKGVSEPGICKIFSLSAIYQVRFFDLIRLYDVDINEIEKYQPVANPHSTQLLMEEIEDADDSQPVSEILRSSLCRRPTSLLPGTSESAGKTPFTQPRNRAAAPITYGYIGLNDVTMYPMIRPGSLVRIDTSQNELQSITKHNEFERPIYFVELRDAYACGWCELQDKELLIIPHHSSPAHIRRYRYNKDAEIVGRVISFDTPCVDEDFEEPEITDRQQIVQAKSGRKQSA
jgi:transcriptional regulator with XRE-family HTH domain